MANMAAKKLLFVYGNFSRYGKIKNITIIEPCFVTNNRHINSDCISSIRRKEK